MYRVACEFTIPMANQMSKTYPKVGVAHLYLEGPKAFPIDQNTFKLDNVLS